MQGWLKQYPKKASILKSAGAVNWFHQFWVVALIRISPFPCMVYNYCDVATNVNYRPYIIGSLVGMVPQIFVAIYMYALSLHFLLCNEFVFYLIIYILMWIISWISNFAFEISYVYVMLQLPLFAFFFISMLTCEYRLCDWL
jgi:uncharacterized membrane protein YdjX (TVP38/TMEM64 family)